MTDKSAAAIREFSEKWCEIPFNQLQMEKELTALISEHYYPKEFTEWATNNAECDGDGKWYLYSIAAIINSPKACKYETALLTTDELFNYWEENER